MTKYFEHLPGWRNKFSLCAIIKSDFSSCQRERETDEKQNSCQERFQVHDCCRQRCCWFTQVSLDSCLKHNSHLYNSIEFIGNGWAAIEMAATRAKIQAKKTFMFIVVVVVVEAPVESKKCNVDWDWFLFYLLYWIETGHKPNTQCHSHVQVQYLYQDLETKNDVSKVYVILWFGGQQTNAQITMVTNQIITKWC